MKLYLAEDHDWALVTRAEPAVTLPCDLLEVGPVVVVRPRPGAIVSPPGPFARPAGTRRWGLVGPRRLADHVWLAHPADVADLRRASDAVVLTLHGWPSMRAYLLLDEPGPALADALWGLAGTLAERGRVRTTYRKLAGVHDDLAPDSPVGAETEEMGRKAVARMDRLTAEATGRIRDLLRLADETEAFLKQQRALERARTELHDAGYLNDSAPGLPQPAADDAADLAGHTSAVIAAYRELSAS